MASYENLVAEIGSRFGTLENKRVYKTQFNNKRQGRNESLEEYAADIKRLYDWAHPNRDASTRQEDLISKFLQGLWDSKARQYIELHREPSSIEEAVQQVAAYMSVTSNSVPNDERRPIRQARTYEKGDNSTSGKENLNPEIQRGETVSFVICLDTLLENVQTRIKDKDRIIGNFHPDKPTSHLKQVKRSNQRRVRTQLLAPCHQMHQNFIPTINKIGPL